MTGIINELGLADDDLLTVHGQLQLARKLLEHATLPHGTAITNVRIEREAGEIIWNTTAVRPDSRHPDQTFNCTWGGELAFTQPATVLDVRQRLYCALFAACVRDVAHDIAEQLKVGGLETDPHADELSVALGDNDSLESSCVLIDERALTARLF